MSGTVETLDDGKLPAGDVTVAVEYSTLNYKDGLVLTSGGGLVKTAACSAASISPARSRRRTIRLQAGRQGGAERLEVGELHWGGYATRARVKGDWLVKLPASISTRAGDGDRHCRLLHLDALRDGAAEAWRCAARNRVARCWSPIRAGGVGSMLAVAILAGLGFTEVRCRWRGQPAAWKATISRARRRRPSSTAQGGPKRRPARCCPERYAGVVEHRLGHDVRPRRSPR